MIVVDAKADVFHRKGTASGARPRWSGARQLDGHEPPSARSSVLRRKCASASIDCWGCAAIACSTSATTLRRHVSCQACVGAAYRDDHSRVEDELLQQRFVEEQLRSWKRWNERGIASKRSCLLRAATRPASSSSDTGRSSLQLVTAEAQLEQAHEEIHKRSEAMRDLIRQTDDDLDRLDFNEKRRPTRSGDLCSRRRRKLAIWSAGGRLPAPITSRIQFFTVRAIPTFPSAEGSFARRARVLVLGITGCDFGSYLGTC